MKHILYLGLALLWMGNCVKAAERPNIIVILSDDMGFSDIGCYGGEIKTPTLDGLAGSGVRMTQFYNTARCCPTRACILTGLYPHQAGMGWMTRDLGHDGYRGDINRKCVTIAEALKPAGYSTFAVGKWHVTKHLKPEGPKHNWPRQRGFDRYYGTIIGANSFWDPAHLVRDNTMLSAFADEAYQPKEPYYYTDAISDHAVRFIDEHCAADGKRTPFFMYVAFTAAHWPMHARERDIAKYKGVYDKGFAAIRAARQKRAKKIGMVAPDGKLTAQARNWSDVPENLREWEIRCMEVYAAMVDSMDQGIGRIVSSLKKNGQFENTLVMFMQDNGGCAERYGRGRVTATLERQTKPTLAVMQPTDLQTGITPRQTRDGYPMRRGDGVMPGPADTAIGYGLAWANVSNTPFREYKHWVHEGGISTPLIAHWPQGIPESRNGKLENQPGHLIDIMATCLDAAGATYPSRYKKNAITPLEGKSLLPALRGRKIDRDAIYWEHEGNVAIRVGKWKAVAKFKRDWELYDMQADRTETNNLAVKMPDKLAALKAKWLAFAEHANFLPINGGRGQK